MPESANTFSYQPEQAQGLSVLQRSLLVRASGGTRWITLDKREIPAAGGLVRRGLAGWDRPTKGSFSNRRPIPGTCRTFWLTDSGRAVAKHVAPPPPPSAEPLTLEELSASSRELALAVLRATPSGFVANRARALLERLDEEEVRRAR